MSMQPQYNATELPSPLEQLVPDEKHFERLYLASRAKENRLYTDEQVNTLPAIDPFHPHFAEWQTRKRSIQRLVRYLERKKRALSMLEVGCGNGWLSGRLACIAGTAVTGMDINETELAQARRVFGDRQNLRFVHADILCILTERKYDTIVFAASIQYFPSLYRVVEKSMSLLRAHGEVHIIDSFLYKRNAVAAAKHRSSAYYRSQGFDELASYYFHHTLDELHAFEPSLLFNPSSLWNRIVKNSDPFPWICIRQK